VVIQLSSAARAEIVRFSRHCPQPPYRVRLDVQPGGCAGLHYTLEFGPDSQPEDLESLRYDQDNIQILVSSTSQPYLGTLTLDYVEDLTGGTFRFENSKATQTCNCGQSFEL